MELKLFDLTKLTQSFIKKSQLSSKWEINLRSFKVLALTGIFIFVTVILLLPTEQEIEFSERIIRGDSRRENELGQKNRLHQGSAAQIWQTPSMKTPRETDTGSRAQVNYNTAMIVGSQSGNAKVQLSQGSRIPLRILDSVVVAQESVPILAESILDTLSESGLRLPAGTRFYGEAHFQKDSDRAEVSFRQISLPNGSLRQIQGIALGKDGRPGVLGTVSSEGLKNAMGTLVTTFISGYATGSMQTDFLGNSKGGVENGLMGAVAATAKEQGSAYAEKLKTQRVWIKISAGTECDALLNGPLNLQQHGEEQ